MLKVLRELHSGSSGHWLGVNESLSKVRQTSTSYATELMLKIGYVDAKSTL